MTGLHVQLTADGQAWRLYVIGDPHLDNAHTDLKRLRAFVDFVAKDQHSLVVIVGDFLDGSTPDHKLFEGKELKHDVLKDIDKYIFVMFHRAKEVFSPLKGRANVVVVQGNHDRRGALRFAGFVEALAEEMGWQYAEDAALVGVSITTGWGRKAFRTVFVHHGAGGGMYPGGKVNRMQQTLVNLADADFYVRGHVHDSFARVLHVWSLRKGSANLVRRPRVFLTAPAWFSGRAAYADRKGYPETDEGVIFVEITEPAAGNQGDRAFKVRRVEWMP